MSFFFFVAAVIAFVFYIRELETQQPISVSKSIIFFFSVLLFH
jgi:hypothetical protein